MLDLERLVRVPRLDSTSPFSVSPSGRNAVFAWDRSGRWEIYELDLAGPSPDSQPVSRTPGASFAPRYSPDGRRLAYAVDLTGGENYRLFVLDRARGDTLDLTPDVAFALQPDFCWSPDGSQLALLADRDGCFDAYLLPSCGGALTKALATGHPCRAAEWSPDGRWLAVEADGRGLDRLLYLLPLAGGEPRPLGDGINARHPAWSPDGRRLAFCSDAPGRTQVGVVDPQTGALAWPACGEGEHERPRWSPDGRSIVCTCGRGTKTGLSILHLDGEPEYCEVAPGVHHHPQYTPDGQRLLFLFDNAGRPEDLWQLDLVSGATHPLTHSLPPDLRSQEFCRPQAITYPGLDGTPVPALLFRPPQTPASALVVIHGGPDWHYEDAWNPFMAHCASRGWAVLAPNYRGSTGYGRDWQNASRFDYGGVDTDDCAAGAMYLVRQGLADPARIAVSGRSHGGYLTMTCLTRFPELWAAGAAVVPFLNWAASHERSRPDLQHWDIENMGDPQEHHSRWREASPFFFLDRVRAPVQLICGANDPRCPAEDSLAARDRLQELGKPVELLLYADEGHVFLKQENLLDAEGRRVAFLAQALEEQP